MDYTVTKHDNLEVRLNALKAAAAEQTKQYVSSKDMLYRTLIDTYLWWHEANAVPGYLDQLFDAANITAKKTGDQVNFSPLIKLVWAMDEKNDSTIAQWNAGLRVIHAEYEANKPVYAKDAATLLVNFIHDQGGLTKLRAKSDAGEDDANYGIKDAGSPEAEKIRKFEAETGITFFKKAAHKAVLQGLDPVLTTKDGLVAAVGRINATGHFELLATSDNDTLVNTLASECAEHDLSGAPQNLRLLTEVIATQALPAKLARFEKKLVEKSTEKDAEGKNKKALPRLMVRPVKGDILLSHARSKASVVTVARPKQPLIAAGNDVFLNGNDRRLIESTYIQGRQLRLLDAVPREGLQQADADKDAAFCIQTTHRVTGAMRVLHFHDKPAGERDSQVDVSDAVAFTPLWKYELNLGWLKRLHVNFTGWWINHHGPHIGRTENKCFSIALCSDAWEISWGKVEDRDTNTVTIELPQGCSSDRVLDGTKLDLRGKDFICVFNALHSIAPSSATILIEGNAKLMKLTFGTELADYEVFIPLCDGTNNRDATHFITV